VQEDRSYLVRCCFIEIYQEEIRDLLGDDPRKKHELKEDPEKGVFVKGVTYKVCNSVEAIGEVMAAGEKHRTVGATKMNATSSRSHSVFTVIIEMNEKVESEERYTSGKLNLVDLAGSVCRACVCVCVLPVFSHQILRLSC
jgi:hypothetical protein